MVVWDIADSSSSFLRWSFHPAVPMRSDPTVWLYNRSPAPSLWWTYPVGHRTPAVGLWSNDSWGWKRNSWFCSQGDGRVGLLLLE